VNVSGNVPDVAELFFNIINTGIKVIAQNIAAMMLANANLIPLLIKVLFINAFVEYFFSNFALGLSLPSFLYEIMKYATKYIIANIQLI